MMMAIVHSYNVFQKHLLFNLIQLHRTGLSYYQMALTLFSNYLNMVLFNHCLWLAVFELFFYFWAYFISLEPFQFIVIKKRVSLIYKVFVDHLCGFDCCIRLSQGYYSLVLVFSKFVLVISFLNTFSYDKKPLVFK